AGDHREKPLSWLDWSRVQSISRDGSLVLFDESGEAVGLRSVSYLYHYSPERTERIGEGGAMGLSPDERWVLLLDNENHRQLRLMPVGGGTVVPVPETGLAYQWARFLPDGNEAIALAEDRTGALGLFRISLREKAQPFQIAEAMMVRNLAV